MLVDGFKLRAALAVVAKNDIRYYLNGVYFSPDGSLHASDGHQAVIAHKAFTPPEDFAGFILQFHGKLPARDTSFTIDGGPPVPGVTTDTLDAVYPDLRRHMPVGDVQPCPVVSVNANLFKNIARVFQKGNKFCGVELHFYGVGNAIKCVHPDHKDIEYILMPCRT